MHPSQNDPKAIPKSFTRRETGERYANTFIDVWSCEEKIDFLKQKSEAQQTYADYEAWGVNHSTVTSRRKEQFDT